MTQQDAALRAFHEARLDRCLALQHEHGKKLNVAGVRLVRHALLSCYRDLAALGPEAERAARSRIFAASRERTEASGG